MKEELSKVGIGLALAAAAVLTTTGCQSCPKMERTIRCGGVNACRGTSGCKTEQHACQGENQCKGEGWVEMKVKDCIKARGFEVGPNPRYLQDKG